MTEVHRIESSPMVEVGRLYNVPCVEWNRGHLVPVISGPAHADPDIGVLVEHIHYDLRFFDDAEIAYVLRDVPLRKIVSLRLSPERAAMLVVAKCRPGEIPRVDRVCLREMPAFPSEVAPWYGELVRAYAGKRWSGECRACPHRGTPLRGLLEAGGVVVCPAHGLHLDAASGEVVI